MSKFIKITVDRRNKIFKNIEYLPQIIGLYGRFSRYLYDDYFLQNQMTLLNTVLDVVERCNPYFWAIIDEKNDKLAGFVFLENFIGSCDELHSAEITTCFEPAYWGKYTKQAARKFIKYCFKNYKLKKIKALVFQQNFKVKTLLKSAGFKKEALLQSETLKNGVLQNIEVYSIVRDSIRKNEVIKNEN